MGLIFGRNIQGRRYPNFWNFLLLALAMSGIWLNGCGNTCFVATSNPPNGTLNIRVSDPPPSCMLRKANGAVRVVMHASVCSSCSASGQVEHIFVTLRGIDVHAGSVAEDTSPDWQELLPHLSDSPRQIDLMNQLDGVSAWPSLGEATLIPASTYPQLRLRFVPNEPGSDQALLERNACGASGFHCVVLQDGQIQPLEVDSPAPELRITSDRIAGGSLLILPESNSEIVLEFNVAWSFSSSDHRSVRLVPGLTASASLKR